MLILNKIFKIRDKSNPEAEKPFLDHLEDFRQMFTRIALTIVITTLVCFTFRGNLMEIIRKPIEQVWVERHEATLPTNGDEQITLDEWEKALSLAEVSAPLTQYDAELANHWCDKVSDERTRRLAEAALIYRASEKLPEDEREDFVNSVSDSHQAARELALKLLENKPTANLNAEGNLRLMSSLKPTETFMLTMKLAFFAGLIVGFPFILYFLLQFILPGLKQNEKKALWPALTIGFGLFLCGVLFAYFYVLPNVLTFFYEWGKNLGISNDWRIGYYISFATTFVLIFGLAFELPVVVMTFVKLGLLSHSVMQETRAYAILAIFVIAALITPTPDALTLCLLAVPMVLLYEICIWLAYFHEKKEKRLEEEENSSRMKSLLAPPDSDADEGKEEDFDDDHLKEDDFDEEDDDDYLDYPGEHQNPEEDPDHDPLDQKKDDK